MSQCMGDVPVGAHTDRQMAEFLREEATHLGVSQSELLRRVFEYYRDCCEGNFECPECGEELRVNL
ncbi:hypothetical protein SAMN04487947_4212 [Halogeometricum rufum]|uniref:Ribbon-helix-helix protein, copG family n=1 Tax=Halogeometricum rufum TaxID=553469 RepID=A0A1I6JA76_9EURY|nr:hypothetical protein SAMN04487947_4212 [Halogeometricum rufum]